MAKSDRRTFLKRSAAAVPAIALAPEAAAAIVAGTRLEVDAAGAGATTLDAALLGALGRAVLPTSDLGADGVDAALGGFQDWLAAYEPVAELNHGYFSAEIRYTPADPGPRWQAQLEALDAEARARHDAGFADLDVLAQRALLERSMGREGANGLPGPARADHVAVGLLAWFYASSEATDLCYRAAIRRQQCRGLEGVERRPPSTGGGAP